MTTTLPLILDIKVRSSLGTYTTNRVYGKQASCTAGPKQAAERLGQKLYGQSLLAVVDAPHNQQNGESHWRLHAEPVFAWAWQSGLIEFGRKVPEGALMFATGMDTALQERVGTVARHGQGKSEGKLLVPGVPEAETDFQQVDALIVWTAWCARRNGLPESGGVIFVRS